MKKLAILLSLFALNAVAQEDINTKTAHKMTIEEQVTFYNKVNRATYCIYEGELYTINSVTNQAGITMSCNQSERYTNRVDWMPFNKG